MAVRRGLIIPDTHIPYHHKRNLELLLLVAKKIKWNFVVIMGDWADMMSLATHPKRLPVSRPTFTEEVKIINAEMDRLDSCFDEYTKKYYIEGNHEERVGRFVAQNMNLQGYMTLPKALRLKQRGWHWVKYHQELRIGKLYLNHDYDDAGQNAHRTARMKVGGNVVIGHTHRMAYEVKGSVKDTYVAAMFGWLGDPRAAMEYRSKGSVRHEWASGFGCFLLEDDGTVHLEPCPIIKGKVKVLGELYSLR